MSTSPLRRRLAAGAAALGAVLAISACMPADDTAQTITLAGSDTTENVMDAVADSYNADTEYNALDTVVNVLSREPGGVTVPGDAHCGTITYRTPAGPGEVVAPNGSSSGRDALRASVQADNGCIDVARSSAPPRPIGSDLETFHYVAFGLDAMGWTSASTRAPVSLTLTQLRGVFNCTFTDWSQVGGTAGPIQRYYPQAGSGTLQFFQNDVLGFNATTFSSPSCPPAIITQENTGELVATNGDQQEAIVPYSAGNFVAQTRGTAPDQRAGQTIRRLNGQSLVTGSGSTMTLNVAGPVNESNVKLNNPTPDFPGIRYVFNVLDETTPKYDQANRLFGFINLEEGGGKSPLCNGQKVAIIEDYGFGPLPTTVGPNNLNGSTCREFRP